MGEASLRPRAREMGIRIGPLPAGPRNAITDVPGVKVGHVSLVEGEGPLRPGEGPGPHGRDGHTRIGIPIDRLKAILERYR